jgi:hypothetical protein
VKIDKSKVIIERPIDWTEYADPEEGGTQSSMDEPDPALIAKIAKGPAGGGGKAS